MKTGYYFHPKHGYYIYCKGVKNFIFLGDDHVTCDGEHKLGYTEYGKEFLSELTYVTDNLETFLKRVIDTKVTLKSAL